MAALESSRRSGGVLVIAHQDPPPAAQLLVSSMPGGRSSTERLAAATSRLTPRHCDTSPGGSYGTPGADTAATRRHIEAECPQRVPFRALHPLGAVVNRPSVWSDR